MQTNEGIAEVSGYVEKVYNVCFTLNVELEELRTYLTAGSIRDFDLEHEADIANLDNIQSKLDAVIDYCLPLIKIDKKI